MPEVEFEEIVSRHYESLYRFALSLTRVEAEACDLTQQTFYVWASKGHQLREPCKVKSWLFTTLHREFLNVRRRVVRFPHFELDDVEHELPVVGPEAVSNLDTHRVLELLAQVKETYRVALTLFYLEDNSYKEIAAILEVPLGTVQSRISRGMAQLQQLLLENDAAHWDDRPSHRRTPDGNKGASRCSNPCDGQSRVSPVIETEDKIYVKGS